MSTEYRGWFGTTARRRCPHSRLVGIYGDPVNHNGGYRLGCLQCGRYIDGPVALARHRMDEADINPCDHEWSARGTEADLWRECWLCGKQEDT